MTRTALFSVFALLSLTACETMQGLQRDTNKLWSGIQSGFSSGPSAQGATAKGGDNSLVDPIASGCPEVSLMPELKQISEFTDPAKPTDKNKISDFTLVGVQSACQQHAQAMAMKIDLIFSGKIGPKGRANKSDKPTFSYPYFIAVTDASGAVVAKEIFAANVTYGSDSAESKQIESITQTLPIKSEKDVANYKLLVGFQLDETQLAYNRAQAQP